MKTFNLMTAIIAIFLFSNLLFAANPKAALSDDKLADLLIAKMGKEVALTDSQKLVMKKKIKTHIIKMQNAHALGNEDEKNSKKNQETSQYQSSLDSILTPSQNQQLKLKAKEREQSK